MKIFRNRTVIGVLCILLALIICFGVTPLFSRSASEKTEIVRVTMDIKEGDEITAEMVQTVEVGAYNLPQNLMTDKKEVVGKYATADLAAGDYILSSKLSAVPAAENAYVWGTYGDVLTESLFAYKLEQYPDGVGSYEDFIRANWLGGRTTDCVGLIKGYGWLSPETMTIDYGTHGMPDIGANQMYYSATESGTIDTMPDIPGLAVWHDGHIGVYIGGGQVVEAMGTKYGVVKTELAGRGWTHWLKIPYIHYD